MDATFGTNNVGMDLLAVLAEVDGTGVPLAYCFVEVMPSNDSTKQTADTGALAHILQQLSQRIRLAGFDPAFFGTDKDASEINAVKLAFPETTIQLCYWKACHSGQVEGFGKDQDPKPLFTSGLGAGSWA